MSHAFQGGQRKTEYPPSLPVIAPFLLVKAIGMYSTMITMSRDWTRNRRLLNFLHDIGLLDDLPDNEPAPRTVLARRCCPLHDGADNPLAFLLYADGFACQTHQCHKNKEFGPNLFGLIRYLVYRATRRVMTFREAIQYAERHKGQLAALIPEGVRYKGRNTPSRPPVSYTAEELAACLHIPDDYFLSRGYRPETLNTFGVGTCVRQLPDGKNLQGWSVLPVTDAGGTSDRSVVGYTARNPAWVQGGTHPKWVHGVAKSQFLFNYAVAKFGTGPFVICEGPGDAMRWFEAGFPRAVAVMGASISADQMGLLFGPITLAPRVYIAADADEVGREFAELLFAQIRGVCKAEIVHPIKGAKDFGDMTAKEIRSLLG